MRLGAIHTPNDMAAHLLTGAKMNEIDIVSVGDWSRNCPADGNMLLNDDIGCCVVVARHWWIKAFVAATTGINLPISNNMIREEYMLNGWDPKQERADGSNPTDVGIDTSTHMLRWQAEPAFDINNNPHAVYWTRIDPLNVPQRYAAMSLTPCPFTMLLPDACLQDMDQWGKAPKSGAGWDPNPNNAHRVLALKWDLQDLWINCWGHHPYVHPEFLAKYVAKDGWDVPIPRNVSDDMRLDYAGLDFNAFQARANDLQQS